MNGSLGNAGFSGILNEMPPFFKLFGGFIFILVVAIFLYAIIRGFSTWTTNNASDVITSPATVLDKRTEVWGGSEDAGSSTNYYVTFELASRTRIELQVRGDRFGLIVVGDHGQLTYQGTRFKEFNR
ncbi:DUF2500 domain-containing protein [Cohnella rhizosphaerae]|uniref:DUF2500 domain-containing protein n=1 Tax=Cohnella rhizosphaerae TaxID=1457232 RepID=A0A9X4QTJ5_9BACL|nr:DUF2500 domain-containing protein [Cohnella rhizosphaerae]MDG0809532.1 DUF2500 domain-containing protein [Cohnella rhizosphaerae]